MHQCPTSRVFADRTIAATDPPPSCVPFDSEVLRLARWVLDCGSLRATHFTATRCDIAKLYETIYRYLGNQHPR